MSQKYRSDVGYDSRTPEAPWMVYVLNADGRILETTAYLTLQEAIELAGADVFEIACQKLWGWNNYLHKCGHEHFVTDMDRDHARKQIRGLAPQIREVAAKYGYFVPDDIRSLVEGDSYVAR